MKPISQQNLRRLLPLLGALAFGGSASAASVAVNYTAADTGNSTFLYNFSITNNCPDDLDAINITDAPNINQATSDPNSSSSLIAGTLMSPAGFDAFFDGGTDSGGLDGNGNGFITFLSLDESPTFSSGSTVSGFSFESAFGPDTNFMNFSATIPDGPNAGTQATGMTSLVPEPSSSALLGLSALGLLAHRRRSA
jgi:hypothetical protein